MTLKPYRVLFRVDKSVLTHRGTPGLFRPTACHLWCYQTEWRSQEWWRTSAWWWRWSRWEAQSTPPSWRWRSSGEERMHGCNYGNALRGSSSCHSTLTRNISNRSADNKTQINSHSYPPFTLTHTLPRVYCSLTQACTHVPTHTCIQTHLAQSTGESKQKNAVIDAGVAFSKTQELPYLPCPQYSWEQREIVIINVNLGGGETKKVFNEMQIDLNSFFFDHDGTFP